MRVNKVVISATSAVADLFDGVTVMIGGFGLCGVPDGLIAALVAQGAGDLHVVAGTMGTDDAGPGLLIASGQMKSFASSYVGENKLLETKVLAGELGMTLVPQGTLAERIRAAGAGIPAFFTPTGAGTMVAEGKELREFHGRAHVLEMAQHADFALVKAWRGDRFGNLVYRKTARNFNPMMAAAAKITVAEIEELVEPGELDPDAIVTPGIYVQRVVVCKPVKRIERRTVRCAAL
jgi:3-oxoacid CoA-transferase subunit A